jgi:phage gp36-like protein
MTWATTTDLLAKFNPDSRPEITELTGWDDGVPDLTKCQEAMDLAEAEIRSHLGNRILPSDDVLLKHIQLDLARRNLYPDEIPLPVKEAAERHLITLKALAKSELALGDPPVADSANAAAMTTITAASGRGF